jgi:hypothetical protein
MSDFDAIAQAMEAGANGDDPVKAFAALREGADLGDVAECLQAFARHVWPNPLSRRVDRNRVIGLLKKLKIVDAAGLVDAALPALAGPEQAVHGQSVTFADPDAWPEPVDGAVLLDELGAWIGGYVHQPQPQTVAESLWVAATWFIDQFDYAPVLAIVSATKRCGKTHLLHLVQQVVRRGYASSGSGITTAVVFRLNDKHRPTLCIDEAEKLAGRNADRELIGMLNAGYRRGARVQRCIEREGDFEVVDFDAYGFRALAAIGRLWDTVMDRAIVAGLERRPADAQVRRFAERMVEREGLAFARRLRRWAEDHREEVAAAALESPRPDWLDDRACDNWSGLFAVAAVAGGHWPGTALAAAQALMAAADTADHTELLIHDVAARWRALEWGDVVKSGDLATALNELEASPWGEYAKGKGLTTHRLAAMFKPLGVGPRQARNARGDIVRGYWYADLDPVFQRFPARVVQPVRVVQGKPHNDLAVPHVPPVPVPGEVREEQDPEGLFDDPALDPEHVARDAQGDGP